MANPVNNMDYYFYSNLSQFINQKNIKGSKMEFRYLHDVVNTKVSMFDYENLPNDLTSEILETAICFNSNLCFYNSSIYGVCLCRYLPLGEYNIYWKPTFVQLLSLNGLTIAERVPFSDIVLVRDNRMDIIPFIYINEYVSKMVEMEHTLLKNVQLLKLPAIFTGNKQMISTFNRIIEDGLGFKPFSVTDGSVQETFQQFDIKLPVSPEEILSLYKNYKNMCLESMGIYGIETQKRERLLVDEVQSQTEYVDNIYQLSKMERERFIEECNNKFGTNIVLKETYQMIREDEIDMQSKLMEATQTNIGGGNDVRESSEDDV